MSGAHRRARTDARRRTSRALTGAAATALVTVAAVVWTDQTTTRGDDTAVPVLEVNAAQAPRSSPGLGPETRPPDVRTDPTSQARTAPAALPTPLVARLPEVGSGEFLVAAGLGPVTGAGVLMTYTVEVEREVPVEQDAAARVVDRVLTDPRGWTATGAHALARVETSSDIRVLLATPETTDALCAPLDTGGRLSCRNGDLVVLNAWRWFNGAPAYADSLRDYRSYLISHEVGHALGNSHVACPGPGRPAPVMMQQTKGLGDCVANPWPTP
ncbi:hypothetical protein NPS01_17840 [Nocardioides psychrotolerans]|uniref:DUF3152 domain-containing protein n=1 Tax=Nocardioides psychrotolerans TaxID=1005945 RepID=A0A1I3ISU1_9ACTN|nr:DUF3152 domain-containing protein [Nocardioides psychrotolerans]GEP38121.1 hypothetical protein NPS01_17840 [Nocardioides psychrotolerans]SFI51016.1 Protein of unknown function [Nocardioides psychrotolerans]